MSLVIVNTRVANLASVDFAFQRFGVHATISADPAIIRAAERVVLPGVGTAGAAMRSLQSLELVNVLRELEQPVLGICLGMQMLAESSHESQGAQDKPTPCLGVIPTQIERLHDDGRHPLPHMGWNQTQVSEHPLFRGLNNPWFYYVHSFAAPVNDSAIAACDYTQPFAAAIAHKNFMGVQFHPERSGHDGAQVLKNFLEISC
ncbi:imidazole glycerol phosphate synthase subunit HisH [Aliidiomarina sanyensis]|uniref:Imidazole glycerol phosphate synthase subunit HisH n=1 Tax=Aliidiomarina sanyensis TaxID=1249555 RepID=A0A432WNI8_9GAMM|nr:imidazole glycerol phosphate synthase subunit HisH [Aliidiomarina sanyensis]RUO35344.1 imidazole glycerol phosphate synthase subunit HisH [Aliidiomarina sanyensis]